MNSDIQKYLKQLHLPEPQSHKGQNGKVLLIGGSDLFHAASRWSLDVVSKFVDMVFYTSVPENNQLIHEAKGEFWNGIVIKREDVEVYIAESDCILIGNGMTRQILKRQTPTSLTQEQWNDDTESIVNYLLSKYPDKKYVIDAGALQMVDQKLLNKNTIITPHQGEWKRFLGDDNGKTFLRTSHSVVLLKGPKDFVYHDEDVVEIDGGNAGMTKGGTGDVLAGLVAALYATNDAMTSAVIASYVNKKAGDSLYKTVGPIFNASDLLAEIPKVFWKELNQHG